MYGKKPKGKATKKGKLPPKMQARMKAKQKMTKAKAKTTRKKR